MSKVVELFPRKTGIRMDYDISLMRQKLDERNTVAITISQRDGLMAMFRRLNQEANQISGTLNVIGVGREQCNALHANIHAMKSLILSLKAMDDIFSM